MKVRGLAVGLVAAALLASVVPVAHAQGISQGSQPGGRAQFDAGINAAKDVRVEQRLDNTLPKDARFRNESGNEVTLGSFLGKKPVWLVMPFYQCKNTCAMMLHGVVETLHDPALKWQVGRDFDVVVISINPKEGPALASATKDRYLSELGIPGADKGWHFLTGAEADIRRVADAAGYTYVYDAPRDQYAHPTVTMMLTPDGRLSRYLFGVVYPGKDAYLAIAEAGKGRIGTVADQLLLMCYHYDPARNKYGLAVFRLLQVFGIGTVVLLGTFMAISLKNERRGRSRAANADGDK